MANIFFGLAALIHVYIFVLESFLWGRPKTNRVFGVSVDQAEQNRLFAFNQGFYNLFLALAIGAGFVFQAKGEDLIAKTLMTTGALSMLGAALVLITSQRKLLRPALIQGLPPTIAVLLLYAN